MSVSWSAGKTPSEGDDYLSCLTQMSPLEFSRYVDELYKQALRGPALGRGDLKQVEAASAQSTSIILCDFRGRENHSVEESPAWLDSLELLALVNSVNHRTT